MRSRGRLRIVPITMNKVTQEELGSLLGLYDCLDDLAHDIATGDPHEVHLAELWGYVKALGSPLEGLNDNPAYCLASEANEPLVVVESDGTVLPPADWAKMKSSDAGLPYAPIASWFQGVP